MDICQPAVNREHAPFDALPEPVVPASIDEPAIRIARRNQFAHFRQSQLLNPGRCVRLLIGTYHLNRSSVLRYRSLVEFGSAAFWLRKFSDATGCSVLSCGGYLPLLPGEFAIHQGAVARSVEKRLAEITEIWNFNVFVFTETGNHFVL